MPQHTQGPWKIDEAEDLPLAVIQDTAEGIGICEIGVRTLENISNARLIAAAPELLLGLEDLVFAVAKLESTDTVAGDAIKNARAAINKARGA